MKRKWSYKNCIFIIIIKTLFQLRTYKGFHLKVANFEVSLFYQRNDMLSYIKRFVLKNHIGKGNHNIYLGQAVPSFLLLERFLTYKKDLNLLYRYSTEDYGKMIRLNRLYNLKRKPNDV